jgi:Zn-dependent membrane protease YugP
LSDHYDPRTNVIRLSQPVFDGTSIASIGIACHEAGHAAQHSENYVPVKMRNAVLPITNVGSALGLPLAIVGYFMGFGPLITIGLLLFSFIVIFNLLRSR